jgi:hypothetical protein
VSRCAEIETAAPALVVAPAGEPERMAAEAHASTCPRCARSLQEAARLHALLDSDAPPEVPSPEALRRVSAAILADLPEPRASWAPPSLMALAAIAAWGLVVAVSSHRLSGMRLWIESGAFAALSALAVLLGAAPAGRRRGLVAPAIVAASLGFVALAGAGEALLPSLGIRCALLELAGAGLVGVAGVAFARLRRLAPEPALHAAALAGGALAAQSALHVACSAQAEIPHLLVFHAGAVVLAALLGAGAGRVLSRSAATAGS